MRTTVDIPNTLYRRLKAKAAVDGATLVTFDRGFRGLVKPLVLLAE